MNFGAMIKGVNVKEPVKLNDPVPVAHEGDRRNVMIEPHGCVVIICENKNKGWIIQTPDDEGMIQDILLSAAMCRKSMTLDQAKKELKEIRANEKKVVDKFYKRE